jgi:hypothetical protein
MRPKVVIVVLCLSIGVLALLGVLHGRLSSHQGGSVETSVPTNLNPPVAIVAEPQTNPVLTSIVASTHEEDRVAQKQKDLDSISDALLAGDGDPRSLIALENGLENPDAEVRVAAREAAMHLGDTNIIPYLNGALQNLQDPREKVAIMDAIAYLQTPSRSDATDPSESEMAALLSNRPPRNTITRTNATRRTKQTRDEGLVMPAPESSAPQSPP